MEDDYNEWEEANLTTNTANRKSMIIGIALAILIASFALVAVGGGFRGSQPYQDVLEAANNDRTVIFELGEPVKPAGIPTGEISTGGLSGEADIRIPVRGPRGRGVLYVAGRKQNGVWEYYTFAAIIRETDQIVELRPPN